MAHLRTADVLQAVSYGERQLNGRRGTRLLQQGNNSKCVSGAEGRAKLNGPTEDETRTKSVCHGRWYRGLLCLPNTNCLCRTGLHGTLHLC